MKLTTIKSIVAAVMCAVGFSAWADDIYISAGDTLDVGEKLEWLDEGFEFRAAEGGDVSVHNSGSGDYYTPGNSDMEVTAQSIVKTTSDVDATVSNWLNVDEIVNEQGCTLTLDGMGEEAQVKKITVGMDGIVEILSASGEESTVTVTDELTAAGGTLLANLKMADGSALLVKGEQKALHVGSTLAMGEDIKLDTATLKALDALNVGDSFWLIDAAGGRELIYEGPTGEDAWYDSVFSLTSYEGDYRLRGNFNIVFDDYDCAFGLKKVVEPIQVGKDAYVVDLDGMTWEGKVPTRIAIRGTGSADGIPADFDRYAVKEAVVEDGITEIGARFFKDFNNLEILQLGKDVAKVGEKAFLYCMSLESIQIENPNFDLSSLDGAINYHTAVNSDGSLYPIPNVTVAGCQQMLEGKKGLTDASWADLGAVVPGKPMSDYTGYHFFRIVLKKIEE